MSAQPNLLAFPPSSQPQELTEKYKPSAVSEFAGIAKPKEWMNRLIENPFRSAWTFCGDSGTGKSSLARVVADALGAELYHIPSQECDLANLQEVIRKCYYMPMSGKRWNVVLVDEADAMSKAAGMFFLSVLDQLPPQTIIIFTCNSTEAFTPRFMSRSRLVPFTNYGLQADAVKLLARIWESECPGKVSPNLARIVKDNNGNIRAALMALELEMLLA